MAVSRRAALSTAGLGGVAALAGSRGAASASDRGDPPSGKHVIEDGYVPVSDDLRMHYRSSGHGQTAIVFVPGWTMTAAVYEHQLRHLADSRRFRAISYDPRAQGLSTLTIEGHYYEQHACDLRRLTEKLGCQRLVLVGWSAGGGDVLEYVRLYGQDDVAGLILLDTPPKVRGTDYTKEWVWFGTKDEGDQDDQLKFYSYDPMVRRQEVNTIFAKWMLDDPTPEKLEFVSSMTNATPNSIAALLNTSYWYLDNTKEAEELDGNVPLLYFTRSEWHDLATKWARSHTPHAVVESYGKHMMFWEHPGVFNAALDRFLAEV